MEHSVIEPDAHGSVLSETAQHELLREQAAILEMVVKGRPLADTLAAIGALVTVRAPGMRSQVLLAGEATPGGEAWSSPVVASGDGSLLGSVTLEGDGSSASSGEGGEHSAETKEIVELAARLAALAIERHDFEDRLAHRAQHDSLTGLPNRALFGELLEHALARARRSGEAIGVLFVDLDRFKLVNDMLGHDAGDELLVALALRFRRLLRPGDIVARFGGDEFTVLCEGLTPDQAYRQATQVADRLLNVAQEPFEFEGDRHFLSVSVGIALAFSGDERGSGLVHDADLAMYRAKERGKGRWEIFDDAMRARARERDEVEHELTRAVERGEFRVFFQPIVSLSGNGCVGIEALLRWQHPERGLLWPRDFMPLAEETGLIIPVGDWLLRNACRQAAEWQRMRRSDTPLGVSVNLSARQFLHPDVRGVVAGALDEASLAPDALCVEITESSFMGDLEAGIGAARALKALGVCLSIDDFGTGYSSLSYLRRLPIDSIKLDPSFVARLGVDRESTAVVAAVVDLGHALGMSVLAEGVETSEQLAELRTLGADAAQGFLFSAAQPAADLTARVTRPHRWV